MNEQPSSPRRTRRRAYAYITHGNRLLVFRQPDFPEAGVQVPGGTIEPGEAPDAAVLREAFEETGLHGLQLVSLLACDERDMADCGVDELQQRWFFHLRCENEVEQRWIHEETSGGRHAPIRFAFSWAVLPAGVPALIAGHDDYLMRLADPLRVA